MQGKSIVKSKKTLKKLSFPLFTQPAPPPLSLIFMLLLIKISPLTLVTNTTAPAQPPTALLRSFQKHRGSPPQTHPGERRLRLGGVRARRRAVGSLRMRLAALRGWRERGRQGEVRALRWRVLGSFGVLSWQTSLKWDSYCCAAPAPGSEGQDSSIKPWVSSVHPKQDAGPWSPGSQSRRRSRVAGARPLGGGRARWAGPRGSPGLCGRH